MKPMKPILQLALDFVDLPRALAVAEEAVAGGADWLEAGTPLIKSEGLQAVRELHARYPGQVIVADMKTMDAGRAEVEFAAKAGAKVVGVLGAASDATIKECVEAARNYGAEIIVDMIQVADVVARAKEAEAMGASYIGIHIAIDEQMQGKTPWDTLREVAAGGRPSPSPWPAASTPRPLPLAIEAGASIVVVGGAITKAADATAATRHHQARPSRRWSPRSRSSSCAPPARTSATCSRGSRPPTSPTPCTAAATSPASARWPPA